MKNKFKVGQVVRIREWEDMEKEFGIKSPECIRCSESFTTKMRHLCGREATITHINGKNIDLDFKDKSGTLAWIFSTDMIEPITETIVIYRSKKNPQEVIALDKRTGNKAIAKCHPLDEFDFEEDAKQAFGRLMNSKKKEGYFKVLCVKDYYTSKKELAFKKGKVYELREGKCTREDNWESGNYKDFNDLILCNASYANHLVELKEGDNPAEILKKYNTIEIGDIVEVINTGAVYSTYNYWSGLGKYRQNYVDAKSPDIDKKYKILNISKHDKFKERTLALIQDPDTTQVFIIGIEGIKKVTD